MATEPLEPSCPFEREDGDGCYSGSFDANNVFTGDWCCKYWDNATGTCVHP